MSTDFTKEPDKEIRQEMRKLIKKCFTDAGGKADINSVMLYSPIIQMFGNELTGRFIKRTTGLALGIACLSLIVSLAALYVSSSSLRGVPVSGNPVVSSPVSTE